MSSAKNHKIRSQRSYRNRVATAEQFQRKSVMRVSQQKVMKEKGSFFTRLFSKFKKGDK